MPGTNNNRNSGERSYLDLEPEALFEDNGRIHSSSARQKRSYFDLDKGSYLHQEEPLIDFNEITYKADLETRINSPQKVTNKKMVSRNGFPEDGFTHSTSSFLWAFAMTPLEASTIPIILLIDLIVGLLLWQLTILVGGLLGGWPGLIVSWIILLGLLFGFNFLVLKVTKVVWAFILTFSLNRKDQSQGE